MRTKQIAPADQPKIVNSAPSDPMNDYEAKDHLDTLMRAEMIKADPEKMKRVHKLAGRHSKAIKSIQDLKDLHNTKYGPGAKADDAEDLKDKGADEGKEKT